MTLRQPRSTLFPYTTLFRSYLKFIGAKGKIVDSLRKELEKVKDNKEATESFRAKISAIDKEVKDYKSSVVKNNRSEEHTSELQSRLHLVCRLLLEKKKNRKK